MVLYAADVMDAAQPIEKKRRGKKPKLESPPTPPESQTETDPVKPTKPKREMSEKQREALKKGQETRKRKREEALAAKKLEEENEIKKKQEEIAATEAELAKKEAQKEKRRLAREKRKSEVKEHPENCKMDGTATPTSEPPAKKPRKKKVSIDDDVPPKWFVKYIEGVEKEKAKHSTEKKPVKQIQQEAEEVAAIKWQDGLTRDRVRHELDNHHSRLYTMMFPR